MTRHISRALPPFLLFVIIIAFSPLSFAQTANSRAAKISAVLTLYEVFNTGDTDLLNAVIAQGFTDHMTLPGLGTGLEGLKEAVVIFRSGLPDMTIDVQEVVVEGDLVAVRQVTTGTHEGDFLGVPATGTRVSFAAFDMYRVQDGLIIESWHVEDLLSVLEQVGALTR